MDKQKEIEKMARVICCTSYFPEVTCKTCCSVTFGRIPENCEYRKFVTRFIEAGYGNVKQAVKEFTEKLKAEIKNYCEIGVTQATQTVDNLFKELYSEDL